MTALDPAKRCLAQEPRCRDGHVCVSETSPRKLRNIQDKPSKGEVTFILVYMHTLHDYYLKDGHTFQKFTFYLI